MEIVISNYEPEVIKSNKENPCKLDIYTLYVFMTICNKNLE